MKINFKGSIFEILNIIGGAILVMSPFWLFPVCNVLMPNGKPMMCHYSGIYIVIIGIIIIAINLISLFVGKKLYKYFNYITTSVLVASCYLVPTRVIEVGHKQINGWQCGLCKPAQMSCNSTLMPAISVIVPVMIFISIGGLIYLFLKKER